MLICRVARECCRLVTALAVRFHHQSQIARHLSLSWRPTAISTLSYICKHQLSYTHHKTTQICRQCAISVGLALYVTQYGAPTLTRIARDRTDTCNVTCICSSQRPPSAAQTSALVLVHAYTVHVCICRCSWLITSNLCDVLVLKYTNTAVSNTVDRWILPSMSLSLHTHMHDFTSLETVLSNVDIDFPSVHP